MRSTRAMKIEAKVRAANSNEDRSKLQKQLDESKAAVQRGNADYYAKRQNWSLSGMTGSERFGRWGSE